MSSPAPPIVESPNSRAMRMISESIAQTGDVQNFRHPSETPEEPYNTPVSPTPPSRIPQKRALDDWRDLTLQAQAVAKEKRLRLNSTADLARYARANADERGLYLFAAALENRDRADDQAESADWKLPKNLKTNCARYTAACLLSPTLPSYKLNFPATVVKLIKALDKDHPGSSQLPSGKNAGQMQLVTAEISSIVIKKRSELKAKIQKSVSNKDCIERLCEQIALPLQVTPTTLFYARIAFIRCQYVSYPDVTDEKFWGHVDDKLKAMRTKFNTADKLKIAMEHFLTTDRTSYKNGANDRHMFAEPFATSDWQQAADAEISSIVPEVVEAPSAPAPGATAVPGPSPATTHRQPGSSAATGDDAAA